MQDIIIQSFIFILGITSIVLISKKNKWGFVIGLLSQPFWLASSFANRQWGVFLLSIAYTFSWSYGIYKWFAK